MSFSFCLKKTLNNVKIYKTCERKILVLFYSKQHQKSFIHSYNQVKFRFIERLAKSKITKIFNNILPS